MFNQTDATVTEHMHIGWIPAPKRRAIWCLCCPILHVVPTENTALKYTASVSKILLIYDCVLSEKELTHPDTILRCQGLLVEHHVELKLFSA